MLGEFSVILPIYERTDRAELEEAIASIISSSLPPCELIISKDGPVSFDVRQITNSFDCSTIFIIVGSTQNQGPGVARNKAIEASNMPVVALMDSDDICRSDRFLRQYKLIIEGNVDIVGGLIREFNPNSPDYSEIRYVPENNCDIHKQARFYQPVNNVTLMFKKSVFLEVGGYKIPRYLEDYDLIYRFVLRGYSFYNIQSILVDVRISDQFAERRKGIKYFKEEQRLIYRMYIDGFLNIFQYLRNAALRATYRIFYNQALVYFHRKLMRVREGID